MHHIYIYIYIYIYIWQVVQESCVKCSTWIGSFNKSVKLSCSGDPQQYHPPSIRNNIPSSIQKRLKVFNKAKAAYQQALGKAGYDEELTYDSDQKMASRPTRKRRRRVVWYNPPYSKNFVTNIGKEFFKLLQLHFPKQHPLHSIFNKNTVKLSYSCTTNMYNILKAHNAKILLKDIKKDEEEKGCNCRNKAACPVANKCLKTNVVYKATVNYEDKTQHYIGMTENSFKTRYTLHKSSFKHSKNRNQTELSNLIWSLTDKETDYNLTWKIIDQARPYQSGKRTCNLCLSEKFHILTGSYLINRKTELLNKCPHRRKFLARNHKPRNRWHHHHVSNWHLTSTNSCLLTNLRVRVYLSLRFYLTSFIFCYLVWRSALVHRNICNHNKIVSLIWFIYIYVYIDQWNYFVEVTIVSVHWARLQTNNKI